MGNAGAWLLAVTCHVHREASDSHVFPIQQVFPVHHRPRRGRVRAWVAPRSKRRRFARVVTATLIPTPIDQVGSSISLITARDIEDHQWRTVPDALQTTPGINVVQSGGAGGQTSVFIRGANSNHTKVLIDGIEANDPSTPNGGFDFGQALTGGVARIEVLRGPQSSLYGSDALGGVIDIVTREGHGAPRLDATIEGGSFETFDQSASLSGSEKRFSYAFAIDHVRAGATPVTPLDLLAPGEARIDDRYDNLTLATKLGLKVNSVLGFGLVARYVDSDLKFTGENYDLYPSPDIPDAVQTDQKERQFFTRGEAPAETLRWPVRQCLRPRLYRLSHPHGVARRWLRRLDQPERRRSAQIRLARDVRTIEDRDPHPRRRGPP